jgi:hypothetical protein
VAARQTHGESGPGRIFSGGCDFGTSQSGQFDQHECLDDAATSRRRTDYDCRQPTPMMLMLNIRHWRALSNRPHTVDDLREESLPYLFGSRYCETNCLSDIAWSLFTKALAGAQWQTFDNVPRIGRILMARGRGATDVALGTAFGRNTLAGCTVWVDDVGDRQPS